MSLSSILILLIGIALNIAGVVILKDSSGDSILGYMFLLWSGYAYSNYRFFDRYNELVDMRTAIDQLKIAYDDLRDLHEKRRIKHEKLVNDIRSVKY